MVSFHSVELRSRVLYICFSLVWSFWLIWDCCECLLFNLCSINLVFTSLYEGFVCFVWLTCMLGVICNIPLIMYHGVCFLSCGLYEFEFRKCVKTVCTVVCVFTCSLLFCVWLVLPSLVSFFFRLWVRVFSSNDKDYRFCVGFRWFMSILCIMLYSSIYSACIS
jgi:Sec-independent protein secretion pathway component TatC